MGDNQLFPINWLGEIFTALNTGFTEKWNGKMIIRFVAMINGILGGKPQNPQSGYEIVKLYLNYKFGGYMVV